jgi:SAM-dependent methyltransferase
MKPEQDAYGQALYDHLQDQGGYEIVEREDGFIGPSAGPSLYFAPFDEWPPIEKQAIQFANGRCLDVGCGAGRVALYLQEKGHDVVGIDNSPFAVKTCQQRGVKDVRLLSITQLSRQKIGLVDTFIMFGNNFGLVGNVKRAKWLLRRFYHMTPQSGRILAESSDPYWRDPPRPYHKAYHDLNRRRGRLPGQLRIRVRYQVLKSPWFEYLLVSPTEMAEILDGTGWHIVDTIPDEERPFYVAIIEKEN